MNKRQRKKKILNLCQVKKNLMKTIPVLLLVVSQRL